jgi:hypothetical protein
MNAARAPCPRRSTAVILVAGLRSANVWRGIESDSRLQYLNLRFYRFTYGAVGILRSAPRLDELAAGLYRFILDEVAREAHELVLVGYSLGGVILKTLLTGSGKDLLDRVRLVLLIATPVLERKRPFIGLFDFSFRPRIQPEYLEILNAEWDVVLKQRSVPVVYILGLRDNTAAYDAGRHWDTQNVLVVDQDHTGLAHDTKIVSAVLYNQLKGSSDLARS